MTKLKSIILCADDFALTPPISKGILTLLEKKRLNATSCLTTTSYWPELSKTLNPFKGKALLGLHLNLTEGPSLSGDSFKFSSIGRLLIQSHARLLNQATLEKEFHLQIDAFEEQLGFSPDFLDGHQHIHHMPLVRDALLTVYEERFPTKKPFLRVVSGKPFLHPLKDTFLKMIIHGSGAHALKKELLKREIPHNKSFSGIYVFKGAQDYRRDFLRFIQAVEDDGLIMCHPGLMDSQFPDGISTIRQEEFLYFSSDEFLKDCNANGIVLNLKSPQTAVSQD